MKPARVIEGLIHPEPPARDWSVGIVVDNFAGGGGASEGIEQALGSHVDVAVNHDAEAVAMHAANHPRTRHHCQSIYSIDPLDAVTIDDVRHPIWLAWFSPDCKDFSKAKGGKPVSKNIRSLAWVVVHWIDRLGEALKPAIIKVENVEEFLDWGPLGPDNKRIPERKGEIFKEWTAALRKRGYVVEWRVIKACDQGAPTIRKRLCLIARCDGQPITWPEASHGPGRVRPWRTAAEIIDWSLPCPSIFDRKKPLAENTLRRIAHGIMKFVVNSPSPFIVPVCNSGWSPNRSDPIDQPFPTVTTARGGEFALATPYIVPLTHGGEPGRVYDPEQPIPTVTGANGGEMALIAPTLVQTGYGERPGQAPRVPGLHKPLGTAVDGCKAGLVSAFLAKHTTGGIGRDAREPAPTVTANGFEKRQGGATPLGIVTAHMAQFNTNPDGSVNPGHHIEEPVSTIASRGPHQAVIATHIEKLYSSAVAGQPSDKPLATVTTGGDRGGGHLAQVVTHLAPHVMTMRNADCPYTAADRPMHTVTAGGAHMHLVAAFLAKYFGSAEHGQTVDESLHTVSTLPRFGLVTVTIAGEEWVIVDIGMRMLTPRELARAQGFRDDYILDPVCDRTLPSGKKKRSRLPIASQIRMIGNSVCPPLAEALVRANCARASVESATA